MLAYNGGACSGGEGAVSGALDAGWVVLLCDWGDAASNAPWVARGGLPSALGPLASCDRFVCAEREASRRNCSLAALDVDALTCARRAPRSPVGVSRYQSIHTQRLFLSPFLPLTSILVAWGMAGLNGG